MKRFFSIVLCVCLIALLCFDVSAAGAVPTQVLESADSVVRILAEYTDGISTGSGFVVKSDQELTLVVTNYHVVADGPYSISVWIGENETVSASLYAYTDQKDICVLKLAYPVNIDALCFADESAKQGEAVYAVGFPAAADNLSDTEAHSSADATITDGIVSALREATVSEHGTITKILQINAAINAGNSGGPLFNANGEVVGINTYGIDGSQGIFGAIDSDELKTFLKANGVTYEVSRGNGLLLVFIAGAAFLVVLAVIIVVVTVKRDKKRPKKASVKKTMTLRAFMQAYPQGLGENAATALLMPIALQLRDLHNDGKSHLQVSPDSVRITKNRAILNTATAVETDRYSSGFAAPEIYKNAGVGNRSDIYSLSALLAYTASGIMPENALARESALLSEADSFEQILSKGMALEPGKRFSSVQEMIFALSPYNTEPFETILVKETVKEEKETVEEKATLTKKRKRVPVKILVPVCCALSVVILAGSYFGLYIRAESLAESGEFSNAAKCLWLPQVTKLHDPVLCDYISAGELLNDQQYDAAKIAFKELSGCYNADELALESDYRQAAQYVDDNEFEKAEEIYISLSEIGYKNSEDKILETKFQKGSYLLYEEDDYVQAQLLFAELKDLNYPGAENMYLEAKLLRALNLAENGEGLKAYGILDRMRDYEYTEDAILAIIPLMYKQGQNLYRNGERLSAEEVFELTFPYLDSASYLLLINAQSYFSDNVVTAEQIMNMFYFEDAAEVLINYYPETFLNGTWRTDSNKYYFKVDGSKVTYNLPCNISGDEYSFYDGKYITYDTLPGADFWDIWAYERQTRREIFSFEAITPNWIKIYCYSNGETYSLYRQR